MLGGRLGGTVHGLTVMLGTMIFDMMVYTFYLTAMTQKVRCDAI